METTQVPVVVDAESIEWPRIELFRRRFTILWDNLKDLRVGQLHGNFEKQKDGSYTGGFDLPNEHRLKSLYVDFRHFYFMNELININVEKFSDYLSSLTNSIQYQGFIDGEKCKLRSGFIENGWFQYKGQSFTTEQVINIWFNAEIFHNNPKKTPIFLDWMKVLSSKTARSMLFMAVYDGIQIIRNINWTASELSRNNLYLKMPNDRLHATDYADA